MTKAINEAFRETTRLSKSTQRHLVQRAQQGHQNAFEQLITASENRVKGKLLSLLGNEQTVEDTLQEVAIKIWQKLGDFRGDSQFYTWYYKIAVNTAKNELTKQSSRPNGYSSSYNDVSESEIMTYNLMQVETPSDSYQVQKMQTALAEAIERLPEDLRIALTLREAEGMSYADAAEEMDCPVGTVRSRIFRAREAVQNELRAQGFEITLVASKEDKTKKPSAPVFS